MWFSRPATILQSPVGYANALGRAAVRAARQVDAGSDGAEEEIARNAVAAVAPDD